MAAEIEVLHKHQPKMVGVIIATCLPVKLILFH